MIDIMIDCETFGVSGNPVLLSIAAVNCQTMEYVYIKCDLESQTRLGFEVSASTIEWWMKQKHEALLENLSGERLDITTALQDLKLFLPSQGMDYNVWSCGALADILWLKNAYLKCGYQNTPWGFWQEKCFRTMRDEFKSKADTVEREGTHHNALDDAIFQAKQLIAIRGK